MSAIQKGIYLSVDDEIFPHPQRVLINWMIMSLKFKIYSDWFIKVIKPGLYNIFLNFSGNKEIEFLIL